MLTTPPPIPAGEMIAVPPQREPLSTVSWIGIILGVIGGALLATSSYLPWWSHTVLVSHCTKTPSFKQETITGGLLPFVIGVLVVVLSLAQFLYQRWPSSTRSSFTLCLLLLTTSVMATNAIFTRYVWQVGWYVACAAVVLGIIGADMQFLAAQPSTLVVTAPRAWQRRAVLSIMLALVTPVVVIGAVELLTQLRSNLGIDAIFLLSGLAVLLLLFVAKLGYSTLEDEPGVMLSRTPRRIAAFGASFALCQVIFVVGGLIFIFSQLHIHLCIVF